MPESEHNYKGLKMAAMLSVCFFFLVIHGAVSSYDITECNADGSFELVENQPASITCTGLWPIHDIYWSIRGSVTGDRETKIGDCQSCSLSSPCPSCSGVNQNFTITRTRTASKMTFKRGLNFGDTAVVKCKRENRDTEKSCRANVIKAYSLPGCKNNSVEVVDRGQTPIVCTNIITSHSITWAITYPGNPAKIIATCPPCLANGTCPTCRVVFNDYQATRAPEQSTMRLTGGNDKAREGSTLECSRADDKTYARCQVHVLNYKLPQCHNGHLDVSEASPWTWIQCDDLRVSHNIMWTITDDTSDSRTVATCGNRTSNYTCSSEDGFDASRANDRSSELRVVERVREQANHMVTCQRQDGAAPVRCRLRAVYGPYAAYVTHEYLTNVTQGLSRSAVTCTYDDVFPSANFTWNVHCTHLSFTPNSSTCVLDLGLVRDVDDVICTVSNTEIPWLSATASYRLALPSSDTDKSEAVPLAVVAGGVGAAAVLVIVIVVVVVFIMRRRKDQGKEPLHTERQPEPEESRNPYDTLHHSDIGLRSTYCHLGNHGNDHSESLARSSEAL